MKIGIIGAGFTGLSAAWYLSQKGHQVTLFEHQNFPGGLAAGFTTPEWDWTLEHHYHHIFASDHDIIQLVKATGLTSLMFFQTTVTSVLYQDKQFTLDSPLSLLRFPALNPLDRFRTAFALSLMRFNPFWQLFEPYTAQKYCQIIMGEQAWQVLWRPLFEGKFGTYAGRINAAWFWARIKVRTKQLGYFKGGFAHLADELVVVLRQSGVRVLLNHPVADIHTGTNRVVVSGTFPKSWSDTVDKLLLTTPSPVLLKLLPQLPASLKSKVSQLKGLAAQTLILELDRPFFSTGTYWLNINQPGWPFLAVVEHTHFTSPKHYGGKHLVYVGKYLKQSNPQFKQPKSAVIKKYTPYLNKLNPDFTDHLTRSWLFQAPFAQPIVTPHHSQHLPPIKLPLPGIYWASLQHVYPFDRGTNYAVKLGQEVAELIHHEA